MDPKQSTPLEPKLQEAYDRVMGVTIDSPTVSPAGTTPVTPPSLQTSPAPSTPTLPVVEPSPSPVTMSQATLPTPDNDSNTKGHAFIAKSGGVKISPVILIVGGVVFLLLYTLVWVKVFNLPIPFINQ